MDPTVEQLARYIIQELGRGVPEPSLRASLIQHGWATPWINAAFQRVYQGYAPTQAQHPNPVTAQQQSFAAPPSTAQPAAQASKGSRLIFKVLIVLLVLIVVFAGGTVLLVNSPRLAQPSLERSARDTERQNDLAQLLSDLSDFYVSKSMYPTREALNDATFRSENGFRDDTIQDPQWSAAATACTKDGKAILAGSAEAHCYAYKTSTSEGAPCNDTDALCTRMTVSILLEKDNKTNHVTFDRNSESEE